MSARVFPIFLVCLPGLEPQLASEARELGFANPTPVPGGVETMGDWPEIWRANLWLRGAGRVLVRLGSFRAMHLAQLDKRARKFPFAEVLRADRPVRIEANCTRSRIYHKGAAAQRVAGAITDQLGCAVTQDAGLRLIVRIEDDLVTLSLDVSGEGLHQRGHKQSIGKAPLRETMAALLLRAMGYTGREPVIDPMCGSGTFVLEAAEIAAGLAPGRSRSFAFEDLAGFDPQPWAEMQEAGRTAKCAPPLQYLGFDRDQGAIRASIENAARASVSACTSFACQPVSALVRPDTAPGIMMVNPPYGGRIGNPKQLFGLYAQLGAKFREEFQGWRLGLITSDRKLAHATGLPLEGGPILPHGGLKIRLYQTPAG